MNSLADNLFDLNLPLSTKPNFQTFFLPNTSNIYFIGRIQKPKSIPTIKPEIINCSQQSDRFKSPFPKKGSISQNCVLSPTIKSNSKNKGPKQNKDLLLTNDLKYNIFKCKEENDIVICSKCPILGKHINNIVIGLNDLKLANQLKQNSIYLFKLDQIYTENDSITSLYDSSVLQLVKGIMSGKSACIFLMGPSK